MIHPTRVLIAALLGAVVASPARAPAADAPIQPGSIIFSSIGQCTMNFIFRDGAGALYVATAAHCVASVGERVRSSAAEFGTVVFREMSLTGDDFSLIRIDPFFAATNVNPAMRNWGGPTGVIGYRDTRRGDLGLQHGYGVGFGSNSVTRPRMCVLQQDDRYTWGATALASFGDSGGPILHETTGQALGFVNQIGAPPSTASGSTTERFLERLAAVGIDVELVTAPYTRPV